MSMKKKTIIECIRSIDKALNGNQWRKKDERKDAAEVIADIKKSAGEELLHICSLMNVTEMQAVILTALVRASGSYRISDDDLAGIIGIDYLEYISFTSDFEGLKQAGFIKYSDRGISISPAAMDAVKQNKPLEPEPLTGLDAREVLSRIKNKLKDLSDEREINQDEFLEYMDFLIHNNKNSVCECCGKYLKNSGDLEIILLYALICRFWFNSDDCVTWDDVEDYYQDGDLSIIRNMFKNEHLTLQKNKVIEPVADGGIFSRDAFHIRDEVKEEIYKDLGYNAEKKDAKNKISASAMLKASDIDAKELFFSKEQQKQIQTLEDLFEETRLNNVMESLKKKGMRTGFTCIFYGAPGTGKTESVYQIARKSGRDIFRIDVSKIKSCWVGESEKNIHRVFEQYRECVKSGGKTPILLFNEADAIFGIRQSGAERAVDKMENSIQNIILQEMEELEGILIATTNLTDNFDKAFDRRFLYKLRFTKPDAKVKSKIWKSMIPELKPSQAKKLAAEFDFSGGQIENIARKKTVAALISGKEPTYAQLREMCLAESISGKPESKKKIGY